MASLGLENKAKEAFFDDDFEFAVDLYTQALELEPKNADLYADRAQANIKLRNFTEAIADANKAIELDPSISKAYLRKGTACIKLEEYQTAKAALEAGVLLAPGDSRFTRLIKECNERIAEETMDMPEKVVHHTPPNAVSVSSSVDKTAGEAKDSGSTNNASKEAVAHKLKYRHDFYNSSTEVVLSIFAKGILPNNVSVDFGEQILRVVIDASAPTSRPSYPSSKSKVDWDKLEAMVKKEEKDEKLDGDAALNKLFRDIYKDADEDTRRAMSKSFIESNGTVLSTNWKEVGLKKVEGSPPEGMEVKKWEY